MTSFAAMSLLLVSACDDSHSDDDHTDIVDITNVTFTKTDPSCSSYQGYYQASVMDIQNSKNFIGNVSVTYGNTRCTIESNTIPNHNFNDNSASFHDDVAEVSSQFHVPITPTLAVTPTNLSIAVAEAVLLNGVTIDLLAAACYDVGDGQIGREKVGCGGAYDNHPWRYDPMSPLNTFGTDAHNAHTQPNGKYHYHGNPLAMFEQDCSKATQISPVVGFAADGYPVFGNCINVNGQIVSAQSSYQLKQGVRQDVDGYLTPQAGVGTIASHNYDGQFRSDYQFVESSGHLDQCNGMTVNGQYGYYITNEFPWVLNCFKGEIDSSFSGSRITIYRSHHH